MSTWNSTLERVLKIQKIHQAIRSGDVDFIQQLSIKNPDSIHGYIVGDKSPLAVALEEKQFQIFSILLSRGFFLDTKCMELLEELSDAEKKKIGSSNILASSLEAEGYRTFAQLRSCGIPISETCSTRLEKLPSSAKTKIRNYNLLSARNLNNANIYYLLTIVREWCGSNTIDQKKSSAIEELFISLNKIKSIRPLLKAVKDISHLEIVFDCNSDTIQCMWPSSRAVGYTIVQRKKILIAAKGHYNENSDFVFDEPSLALETIMHEITHFVMENLYNNDGKPYYKRDHSREKIFKQITDELKTRLHNGETLDSTFSVMFNNSYDEASYESEIIARASELMVKYSEDEEGLRAVREYAGSLLHFYEETLKHVDSFNKSKFEIRELNRSFKVYEELINSEISFKSEINKIQMTDDIQVITSNAPLFCLAQILNELQESFKFDVDASAIFVKYNSYMEKFWDVICAFFSSDDTVLVVNCEENSEEDIVQLLSSLEGVYVNKRMIIVTRVKFGVKSEGQIGKVINFEWDDLESSTQKSILEKSVVFQNEERKIKLSEIITIRSEACKLLPLQITFANQLKIDKSLNASNEGFCLPRNFLLGQKQINGSFDWDEIRHDELLLRKNLKKVLISDIAGTGKTVIFEKIAQDLKNASPECWVELLDLKNYTTELKQVEQFCATLDFLDLLEKVFKKDISDFDREILHESYNNGKLILLLDSFDEISPYFKEVAETFIRKFASESGNQLWVATRPHLEEELESSFDFAVVKLKKLTREDQMDFLMQSWGKTDEETKKKAEKLIGQFQELISSESGFIGYPMLVKMIADVKDLEDEESFSYFSIYDNFWKNHISNWGAGSKVANEERNNLVHKEAQGCSKVHQILAIRSIFGSKFTGDDLKIDDEWTDEKILRVRVVKSMKTYKFIHETFAEYFVSVFIRNSLEASVICSRNSCLENSVQITKTVVLDEGHRIIRSFLNESLKNITVSNQARKKIKEMIQGLDSEELKRFLYYVVKEDLDVILDLFQLETLKTKTIVRLLQGSHCNYVHSSFSSNRGAFLRCLIRILQVLNKKDQKKLLKGDVINIYQFLLQNPYQLDPEVLVYLETVFSKNEIEAMLFNKSIYVFLKKPVMKNACCLCKKYLNPDQIKEFLFGNQEIDSNFLNYAVSFDNKHGISSLFKLTQELFGENSDELKKVLTSVDATGRTLLLLNLELNENNCSYEALRASLFKSGLSVEEVNNLIKGASTETLVDCLVKSRRNYQACGDVFSLFPPEEQLSLIIMCLKKSEKRNLYSFDSFVKKHSELWDNFKDFMTIDEIKKLIIETYYCCDWRDPTSFTYKQYETNMEKHFSILARYFNEEEIVELLLRDHLGKNVMTCIVDRLTPEKIETFFKIIQNFGSDLSRKLFLSSDPSGNNIFHASAKSHKGKSDCKTEIFSTVLYLMKDCFEIGEVRQLLLAYNSKNESVMSCLINNPYFHKFWKMISFSQEESCVSEFLEVILSCQKRGSEFQSSFDELVKVLISTESEVK